MIRFLLIGSCLFLALGSFAQTPALLPDQNPNYLVSQHKYTQFRDSLLQFSNTTIDQSYKAYDWYQAREERRNARRNARWQRNYTSYGWNNWPYSGYYNNGWGYNNGWNSWGLRPYIGFRTGNWFFGF